MLKTNNKETPYIQCAGRREREDFGNQLLTALSRSLRCCTKQDIYFLLKFLKNNATKRSSDIKFCPECLKDFPRMDNLKNHRSRTHDHECDLCAAKFVWPSELKKHRSAHTVTQQEQQQQQELAAVDPLPQPEQVLGNRSL